MQIHEMRPGKPLELFVTREGYRYRLVSKVEAVEKDKVYISLIASAGRIFRFLPSDEVDFIYKDGGRMWRWNGVTGSVAMLDDEKVHCLESEKEGEVYNRRNAFRVHLGAEHVFEKMIPKETQEEVPKKNKGAFLEDEYDFIKVPCVIKDLSEGGVGIYTNDKMDIGTRIEITFPARQGPLKVAGEVVRRSSGDYGKYREFYGCSLDKIDNNLSRYIFDLQRLQLKKERGES